MSRGIVETSACRASDCPHRCVAVREARASDLPTTSRSIESRGAPCFFRKFSILCHVRTTSKRSSMNYVSRYVVRAGGASVTSFLYTVGASVKVCSHFGLNRWRGGRARAGRGKVINSNAMRRKIIYEDSC